MKTAFTNVPSLPITIPFLFLFEKDPGVLCPYKHLLCQALTDRHFLTQEHEEQLF